MSKESNLTRKRTLELGRQEVMSYISKIINFLKKTRKIMNDHKIDSVDILKEKFENCNFEKHESLTFLDGELLNNKKHPKHLLLSVAA